MARIIGLLVFSVFALVGCSSGKPAPKKAPPPPPTSPTIKPAAPKVETPKPEAPKTGEPAKKEEPKTEAPKKAEPTPPTPPEPSAKTEEPKAEPQPASVKDAPLGPATGYENEFAGGKTVRAWITVLDSDDKEKLGEAFEIFKMVGKRAGMAVPKLEVLSKSSDPEIAKGAREALHAVKSGQ